MREISLDFVKKASRNIRRTRGFQFKLASRDSGARASGLVAPSTVSCRCCGARGHLRGDCWGLQDINLQSWIPRSLNSQGLVTNGGAFRARREQALTASVGSSSTRKGPWGRNPCHRERGASPFVYDRGGGTLLRSPTGAGGDQHSVDTGFSPQSIGFTREVRRLDTPMGIDIVGGNNNDGRVDPFCRRSHVTGWCPEMIGG